MLPNKSNKSENVLRLSSLCLCVSLIFSLSSPHKFSQKESFLAPRHESQVSVLNQLERPLTKSLLLERIQSVDLDEQVLAKTLLSKQNKTSGLIFAFAAAIISAGAITGQELILKEVNILHYLLIEPIFMSLLFVFALMGIVGVKVASTLRSFFNTLAVSNAFRWFVASLLLSQLLLPALFFFTLTQIGATSMNMIAALTLFFTPLFEWFLLGIKKFKRRHFLSFFLLFWGVVGFKLASVTSASLILLGIFVYLIASAENVIRKKIVELIGNDARTTTFTLSLLIWNRLFSFVIWFFIWFGAASHFYQMPLLDTGENKMTFLELWGSPFFYAVLGTAVFLAVASFLEQKTRTIKQFPVSILEGVRQSQIVFTALLATGLVFLSKTISLSLPPDFMPTTLSQWLFIPVILAGVALLSYFQREDELKEEASNGSEILSVNGVPLREIDWLMMLKEMKKASHLIHPSQKATSVCESYIPGLSQVEKKRQKPEVGPDRQSIKLDESFRTIDLAA